VNNIRSLFARPSSTYRRPLRRAAATILVALMPAVFLGPLAGCAWTPTNVHADPALTSHDLVQGKIAIMPVKFDNDKATPKERSYMVVKLIRAVQQSREDIPLATNTVLHQAHQGALEEEAKFLHVYDDGGTDPSRLAPLKESLDARYFVLSRLHYDQTTHGGASTIVESTLSGKVSIVDTTTGAAVWEGEFSTTRSNIDNLVDPHPSVHALPFFSTFVRAWPVNP